MFISVGGKRTIVKGIDQVTVCRASDTRASAAHYVCDGYADDIQIQQAIDGLAAIGGGTVHILGGEYDIRATIYPKSNVNIYMEPTTFLKQATQTVTKLTKDLVNGSTTIEVEDATKLAEGNDICVVRGTSAGLPAGGYVYGAILNITKIEGNVCTLSGAWPGTTPFLAADNCAVSPHFSMMYISGQNKIHIKGGALEGNRQRLTYAIANADACLNGICSGAAGDVTIEAVTVTQCFFQGIHPWGEHPNYRLLNCACNDNGFAGICIDTLQLNTLIEGCTAKNNPNGLQMVDSSGVTVLGGFFHNNGIGIYSGFPNGNKNIQLIGVSCNNNSHGIELNHITGGIVSGANLDGNVTYSVVLTGCVYCSLDALSIMNSPVGIVEESGCGYNMIGENIVFKNVPVPIQSSSMTTKMPSNDPIAAYRELSSATGTFDLPLDLAENVFQIEVEGQSTANLLGSYGDIQGSILTPVVGVVSALSDGWNIQLAAEHQQADGFYDKWVFKITSGSGAGQIRLINGYNGTTNQVHMNYQGIDPAPDTTSHYEMYSAKSLMTGGWHGGKFYVNMSYCVQMVSGYYGLDCPFTDSTWPTNMNVNHIKIPTVSGHKYLMLFKYITPTSWTLYASAGTEATQKEMGRAECNSTTWKTGMVLTPAADGDNILFCFWGGYPNLTGQCYIRNIMVLDLTVIGDADKTSAEITEKYTDYTFNTGSGDDSAIPGCIKLYKDRYFRNLLGKAGNIEINAARYNQGPYGYFGTPLGGLIKTVDGYKCIDGWFSDYNWPTAPRCSMFRMPSSIDKKYLIRATVKGTTAVAVIKASTGANLDYVNRSASSWGNLIAIYESNGEDLIFAMVSAYVSENQGYFRDLMVLDLTYLGDDALDRDQLWEKYGSIDYFDDIKVSEGSLFRSVYIPKLLKVGVVADKMLSDGTFLKRVKRPALASDANLVEHPAMTVDSNLDGIADDFTKVDANNIGAYSVGSTGQSIGVNHANLEIAGGISAGDASISIAFACEPEDPVSFGFRYVITKDAENNPVVNFAARYRVDFLDSLGSVISGSTVIADFSSDVEATMCGSGFVAPAAAEQVKLTVGIKPVASTNVYGVLVVKNIAVVKTSALELDEEGAYFRYALLSDEKTIMDNQLVGLGRAGDPVSFVKEWYGAAVVDEAALAANCFVPSVLPIAEILTLVKVNKDSTVLPVDISLAHVALDGLSFSIDDLVLGDIYRYTYLHDQVGISPEIVLKVPKNNRAQFIVNSEVGIGVEEKASDKLANLALNVESLLNRADIHVATTDPTASDIKPTGTTWINTANNRVFMGIHGGSMVWVQIGG